MINNAIADPNIKSNNLLAEFLFSNSFTLSVLFKSYCMNIYGSPLWRYNNHSIVDNFCGIYSIVTMYYLVEFLNIPCNTSNSDTTIGENVRLLCINIRLL